MKSRHWGAGVLAGAWLCFVISGLVMAGDGGVVRVVPAEDREVVVHNPDMGWVLYENYPLDWRAGGSSTLVTLPGEDFAGVDQVALMFAWSDVEAEPGRYDWSRVDFAYDYWRKRGKGIQLRMSTESLVWWTRADPPTGLGVPGYVVKRMGKDRVQVRDCEGIPYTVVDAREPYYLERLTRFLAEVRGHFGKSRPVTLIDLRGFGLWGEWHSGYRYPTEAARRAALVGVIDRYAEGLPGNFLALSFSYDPDSPAAYWSGPVDRYEAGCTATYRDFMWYSAFDYALTKPNVTLRRDGVGGAVHSNERRLVAEHFAGLRGPVMAEFMDGYEASKKGGDGWLRWKLADALSIRPNYINLLGYQGGDALAFMRERGDLVAEGLREMGYRFVPVEVRYPGVVAVGERVNVEARWVNRGVGRCLRDYLLTFSVTDREGREVGEGAGVVGTREWLKGGEYGTSTAVVVEAAGEYELRVIMTDPRSGRRVGLPLKGRADGSYVVGRIVCQGK